MSQDQIKICCGTCVYADLEFYNSDTDSDESKLVDCRYPAGLLPLSMRAANRERSATTYLDSNCPTWKGM